VRIREKERIGRRAGNEVGEDGDGHDREVDSNCDSRGDSICLLGRDKIDTTGFIGKEGPERGMRKVCEIYYRSYPVLMLSNYTSPLVSIRYRLKTLLIPLTKSTLDLRSPNPKSPRAKLRQLPQRLQNRPPLPSPNSLLCPP